MVNSQEIIERSLYSSVLEVATKLGYAVNPNNYLPVNADNQKKYEEDVTAVVESKGFTIEVFGVGNNQSRGIKNTPRITIESEGFFPGDIGLPPEVIEKTGHEYFVYESPTEALSQFMNIRLCASTANHMRLLHQILFWSIPQRGYIKPYTEDKPPFSGNIFIQLINFYNSPDLNNGLLEKVYQFEVKDFILEKEEPKQVISSINEITLTLDDIQEDIKVPEDKTTL